MKFSNNLLNLFWPSWFPAATGFHSLRMCWWKRYFFVVLNLFLDSFIHVSCEWADCSLFTISFAVHHTPFPWHPQGSTWSCRTTAELPREVRYTGRAEKRIGIFLLATTFITKYYLLLESQLVAVLNAQVLAYKPVTTRGLCVLHKTAVFCASTILAWVWVSFLKQMLAFDSAAAWIHIHSCL